MKAILFGISLLLLVAWLGFLLGLFLKIMKNGKIVKIVWFLQFFMSIASIVMALEMFEFLNFIGIILGLLYLFAIIYLTNKYRVRFRKFTKRLIEMR